MSEEIIDVENDIKPSNYIEIAENSPLELTTKTNQCTTLNTKEFDFALPARSINNKNMVMDIKHHLSNAYDRENWSVSTDHCYARPWDWRPETSFLRPTKTLFIAKSATNKRKSVNPLAPLQDVEDAIDVDTDPELATPIYDVVKARGLMSECERLASSTKADNTDKDWEEKVSKFNWTPVQNRVFNSVVNILNSFNLGKLAYEATHNEPLARRTIIDKAVQRVRRLLATVSWDPKVTQWLHQVLVENLNTAYLGNYLDILQTLKAKLPTFVDKMIYGPSTSMRMGPLSSTNLYTFLEKPWDPVASSLTQDKPKKLPGNPVIILVPSAPIMSKRINKWINLLSHLATVVTIPTNFGSAAHRMTMTNCTDQMFSMTRGKIQDVRNDYPGRHIVLLGFNAGGTLALQVAQVEPVMCVVALGFSLLTAEGTRGEPDDNLLELQCPILFVIGQCSNTSLQEDMEDLRERMRVETGLIVVGSADDYLRVNKKRKRAEGITQSIVDRCIVDEVGEFISGIILSPYPPQIRQSPTHVSPESALKKGKLERKRYNSNASSVDSEPPSPTPRITRPVGRPPGSKSKSRLEAKWAQQIAQGTSQQPPSPSSSPPPYPHTPTPDTSSNDSSLPEKQIPPKNTDTPPVKKIKTLKPVLSTDKTIKTITPNSSPGKNTPTARMQAYGFNRSVMQGSNLSTLLQGGIKTIPPTTKSSATGIKVLENVALNSATTAKLISNAGRTIDLSKITVINSLKTGGTAVGNVVLLPDGKLKTVHGSTVKGTGGTPIMLPLSPQKGPKSRNKYITAKRQLLGNKPPKPLKKPMYLSASAIQALPPPTNLTSQDIMDLPIIFADDNQILDAGLPTTVPSTSSTIPTTAKIVPSHAPGKFVLVNKQSASSGNYIITPGGLKKQGTLQFGKQAPKYTKIILSSKKCNVEEMKISSKIQNLSPEITIKKVASKESLEKAQPELIDLENEIQATEIHKPIGAVRNVDGNLRESVEISVVKRSSSAMELADDAGDDHVPRKSIRLEET